MNKLFGENNNHEMIIKETEFIKSATNLEQCTPEPLPEYAFIGRSNVGKSSLINMLVNKKGLAKTSSSPGKTQTINFFKVNKQWMLVDLPGYGYAKVSQEERAKWKKMIWDYIEQREFLMCIFILVDLRIEPQKSDMEFVNKVGEIGVPLCIVFTKADKIPKTQIPKSVAIHKKEYLKHWEELPLMFISSTETKSGREEILEFIEKANEGFANRDMG
ncbi:MAG TPA: ribosome biogenesis GTP-binding protein YihA/YsxC [Bacteroidia bacterium]|nr:ribosome biogenesis GTP-binding protein YihA/YsxC [Bacteroidia bacterium]